MTERRTPDESARLSLRQWSIPALPHAVLAVGLNLAAVILTIVFAWGLAHGVAAAMGDGDATGWMLSALGALAGRTLVLWLAETRTARAGLLVVEAARLSLVDLVTRSGAAPTLGAPAGVRVSQIVDRTARLSGWASRWLPGSYLAVLVPAIILVAVLTQSWVAALLLAGAVLVLPVFLWLTIAQTRTAARDQQASLDALQGAFQTRTEHAGLIRAFRAISRETNVIRLASEALRRGTMRVLRRAFLSSAVLDFFSALSIALLAVYIGFKLLGLFPFETGETITLQEGVMVLVLAPEFFGPIRRMSSLHHDRADALAAAGVLAGWASDNDGKRQTLPVLARAPNLSFVSATLAYGDAVTVRNLTFEAAPGAITVIAGPSGAGKTSALLALLGLVRVAAGSLEVDGAPLSPGESLAASIAYVRQSPWLFEGTLAENLRVGRLDASDGDLLAALSQVGASALVSPEHGGLLRVIQRGGQGLSGGERQRIALARALLRDACIWLLDEPTAHLDEDAEAFVLAFLRTQSSRRTIIIATHEEAVWKIADRLVLLAPGERRAA